jgi:chromosomal replication initiation ATPase DnaA
MQPSFWMNIGSFSVGRGPARMASSELRRLAADRPYTAAQVTAGLVGLAMGISPAEILSPCRGSTRAAFARQLSMYLLHTSLSLPYGEIARICGRDRTTVSHACRTIEDARDDWRQDRLIQDLEEMLLAVDPLLGTGETA